MRERERGMRERASEREEGYNPPNWSLAPGQISRRSSGGGVKEGVTETEGERGSERDRGESEGWSERDTAITLRIAMNHLLRLLSLANFDKDVVQRQSSSGIDGKEVSASIDQRLDGRRRFVRLSGRPADG